MKYLTKNEHLMLRKLEADNRTASGLMLSDNKQLIGEYEVLGGYGDYKNGTIVLHNLEKLHRFVKDGMELYIGQCKDVIAVVV